MHQPPYGCSRSAYPERCRAGACFECTPHVDLRDLLSEGVPVAWRQRLLILLVRAGITSPQQIEAMTDDELLTLMGPRTVATLRERLRQVKRQGRPTAAGRLADRIEAELRRHLGPGALP